MNSLDILATGSQAAAFGLVRRLDDVTARYAAILGAADMPRFTGEELRFLSAVEWGESLDPSTPPTLRATLLAGAVRAGLAPEAVNRVRGLLYRADMAALVLLIERLEEMAVEGL